MLKVFGIGRLVADPELKVINTEDGREVKVVKFTLVSNEVRGKGENRKQDAHFFDCEAWDSGAQVIADYVKKGDQLLVEAKLREQKWTNSDGENRRKTLLRIESFELVSNRKRPDDAGSSDEKVSDNVPDDEVPF